MSDWWATVRIFPPSPLEPGIPFLNHLSLYSILHSSTSLVRGIPRRDTHGAAARGEGGLRRHGRARGGGSGEFMTACGGANGPATRADQGVCVATRGSCHAQPTRPKRATHEGENEGEKKDIFIPTQRARMPQPPHATTFCLRSTISQQIKIASFRPVVLEKRPLQNR